MNRTRLWLAQQGFDNARLDFGLRTALASCLALLLAWSLGLEHPQWSAMTVWVVSQPTRGLLIEKSFFRVLGTLVGTLFGMLLVWVAGDNQLVLVLGLAGWVGLCTGCGNLLSGLIAYGTLLAGYSASMVALLTIVNTADIAGLGMDRLLTVLTGVVVALVVGLVLGRGRNGDHLGGSVQQMTVHLLDAMAARLGGAASGHDVHLLLGELAAMEAELAPHGAGSLRLRHSARSLRALLSAQVATILWLKRPTSTQTHDGIAAQLTNAARALEANAPLREIIEPLRQARVLAVNDEVLARTLGDLMVTLQERHRFLDVGVTRTAVLKRHLIRHRDWGDAGRAMFRTSSVLLLIGLVWVRYHWLAGPYVLLGTSVMITLFSTFENPAMMMRHIMLWQVIGAAAAIACHWLLWPYASAEWQLVLMLMPWILIGVVPFAHRRTMFGAMDYQMSLLLLSQPGLPLFGSVSDSLAIAMAVVAAPLLAWFAFSLVFPKDLLRSRKTLKEKMIGELPRLASAAGNRAQRHIWQTRLNHRILKLVHMTNKFGEPTAGVADGSLTIRELGLLILNLQQRQKDPQLGSHAHLRIRVILRRLERELHQSPHQLANTLSRLARGQRYRDTSLSRQFQSAADGVMANLAFFQSA